MFDDKSAFNPPGPLRRAFNLAFGKDDADRIEALVTAAVDNLWEKRQIPDREGDLRDWPIPYSTKAELAVETLDRILTRQKEVLEIGDVNDFNFILLDRAGSELEVLRGEAAVEAINDLAKTYLIEFGIEGLAARAKRELDAGESEKALEPLAILADLQPENGMTWFHLGLVLQDLFNNEEARGVFRNAAELLESPYLDNFACPRCGWIPIPQPMWPCGACGEMYDAFETEGRCPKCSAAHEQTECVACHELPSNGDWRVRP